MSREEVPIVKGMSWASIQGIANTLLQKYYPDCLKSPLAVPIDDFLEFVMPLDFGVDVRFGELPPSTEAVMQPITERNRPEVLMSPKTYEGLLACDGRSRYTAAHEAFHGIHHAKQLRSALIHGSYTGLYRRIDIRPFENPERQADVFAARFLMPEEMIRLAYEQCGGRLHRLTSIFQVSYEAMHFRLKELGLRDGGVKTRRIVSSTYL